MENNLKEFDGKICKIWLKDGFYRQGIVLYSNVFGIFIDDRVVGKTFLNFDNIKEITEVKGGSRQS